MARIVVNPTHNSYVAVPPRAPTTIVFALRGRLTDVPAAMLILLVPDTPAVVNPNKRAPADPDTHLAWIDEHTDGNSCSFVALVATVDDVTHGMPETRYSNAEFGPGFGVFSAIFYSNMIIFI